MSNITNHDFLAEYERESDWAAGLGVHPRTVARYRDAGLPFLRFGGFVWIPKKEGREWIAGRIHRKNPPRKQRQTVASAEISASS
jgi:hypothetical protein